VENFPIGAGKFDAYIDLTKNTAVSWRDPSASLQDDLMSYTAWLLLDNISRGSKPINAGIPVRVLMSTRDEPRQSLEERYSCRNQATGVKTLYDPAELWLHR